MKKNKFLAIAILATLSINQAFAESKPYALVNGKAIPQERFDVILNAELAKGQQADSPELRKMIGAFLTDQEVVAQEAVKIGLDKNPEVLQQIELAKQAVLYGAFMQDHFKKNPISNEDLQKAYEKIKTESGDKLYTVRHIQVATKAEAEDIIAKLGKKAKFEQLAKQSKDPGSAENGGLLGQIPITKKLPETFANALLHLKKGEYTKTPVQTQAGWHVIKLDDIQPLQLPSIDELKPRLQQGLQAQAEKKTVETLRNAAKVVE